MDGLKNNRLRRMFKRADDEGYAIPAFNYTDIWDMKAIVESAEELSAPVIIQVNARVVNTISVELCGAIGLAIMKKANVPVIHHLDHSNSVELCKKAIDAGFPSVMIDTSALPLEENITAVKEVVEYAHTRGVHVEGEIGRIKGKNFEGSFNGDDYLVNVKEAVELVGRTNVDSLAIGIGTAHGFYKGKPEINFERLIECDKAISIPLVLHGGTGIPEEDVRRAIQNGMRKVNVGTQIFYTYMKTLREVLNNHEVGYHTISTMEEVIPHIKNEVKRWIKVCMADGKA